LEPDVEKAKREDLQKQQTIFSVDKESLNKQSSSINPQVQKTIKISSMGTNNDPKKQAELQIKKQDAYKTPGAATNNRITERNQKNQK